MKKRAIILAVLCILFGCTREPFYQEDKMVVKECIVELENQVHKLKTTVEHEFQGDYSLRYVSYIILDSNLDFDKESETNLVIELIEKGHVIESSLTLPKENLAAYIELTEHDVVDLIGNVSYQKGKNPVVTIADGIKLKFTKTDEKYVVESIPVKT